MPRGVPKAGYRVMRQRTATEPSGRFNVQALFQPKPKPEPEVVKAPVQAAAKTQLEQAMSALERIFSEDQGNSMNMLVASGNPDAARILTAFARAIRADKPTILVVLPN